MSATPPNSSRREDLPEKTVPTGPTFFARWRVRLGYPLAIVVLLLAHPAPNWLYLNEGNVSADDPTAPLPVIGGLFMAGLLPAGLMALALIGVVILLGGDARLHDEARLTTAPLAQLWRGAIVTLGLLVIIFVGFRFGVATATEISAFAALYALVVGGLAFRELGPRAAARTFINAAIRSGTTLPQAM